MVRSCYIVGCTKNVLKNPETSFHRIPAVISETSKKYARPGGMYSLEELIELSKSRQKAWINAIRRGSLNESQLKSARICSDHFLSGHPADITDKHNPDWVPCSNLGYNIGSALKRSSALQRHSRHYKRIAVEQCVTIEKDVTDYLYVDAAVFELETGTATQTDINFEDLTRLFDKLTIADAEIEKLNMRVQKFDLIEDSFFNNDCKALYFTGLNNCNVLFSIHRIISPNLFNRDNTTLTTFQQLLLALMKLRLNLSFTYLAYRFGIGINTASRYFHRCLHVLYCKFKHLIYWPERDTLHKTMPECFQEAFGKKVSVIIDCFEVSIQRPSNLYSSAQCWSNYKHHKTVKILLGMTPHGSVSFISEAWGGRTSDKNLSEMSGLIDRIFPGDVVLADRGFLIEDLVQMGARLNIPAFTKGKSQLHPTELEDIRSIAQVKIHVERLIGSVRKKYPILSSTVPISMLCSQKNGISVFDKVVYVCCALVNLCPSMVPMV